MGVPGRRSRGLTRPGLPLLAAAGSAVLAAACGSQAATTSGATQPASTASPASSAGTPGLGSAGPAAGAALCSGPAAVTRLVVRRVSALPQNHLHFTFPAVITVASPGQARAVAEAVCGLPLMPRVVRVPCRPGTQLRAKLHRRLHHLPRGHRLGRGLRGGGRAGPVRSAARSPGFWPSWPAP